MRLNKYLVHENLFLMQLALAMSSDNFRYFGYAFHSVKYLVLEDYTSTLRRDHCLC